MLRVWFFYGCYVPFHLLNSFACTADTYNGNTPSYMRRCISSMIAPYGWKVSWYFLLFYSVNESVDRFYHARTAAPLKKRPEMRSYVVCSGLVLFTLKCAIWIRLLWFALTARRCSARTAVRSRWSNFYHWTSPDLMRLIKMLVLPLFELHLDLASKMRTVRLLHQNGR